MNDNRRGSHRVLAPIHLASAVIALGFLGVAGCGEQSTDSSEAEIQAPVQQEELKHEAHGSENAAFEYHAIFLELQELGILDVDPREGVFTGARQLERAQQQIAQALAATRLERCDWAQHFYYFGGPDRAGQPHLKIARYWQAIFIADAARLAELQEPQGSAKRVAGAVRLAHHTASSDPLEWMDAIAMLVETADFVQHHMDLWQDEDRDFLKAAFAQYENEDPLGINAILELDGQWAYRRRGANPTSREFFLLTHEEQLNVIERAIKALD